MKKLRKFQHWANKFLTKKRVFLHIYVYINTFNVESTLCLFSSLRTKASHPITRDPSVRTMYKPKNTEIANNSSRKILKLFLDFIDPDFQYSDKCYSSKEILYSPIHVAPLKTTDALLHSLQLVVAK